jgi:hypothetical protein
MMAVNEQVRTISFQMFTCVRIMSGIKNQRDIRAGDDEKQIATDVAESRCQVQ